MKIRCVNDGGVSVARGFQPLKNCTAAIGLMSNG